jgi:hypothetical protein
MKRLAALLLVLTMGCAPAVQVFTPKQIIARQEVIFPEQGTTEASQLIEKAWEYREKYKWLLENVMGLVFTGIVSPEELSALPGIVDPALYLIPKIEVLAYEGELVKAREVSEDVEKRLEDAEALVTKVIKDYTEKETKKSEI